MDAHGSDSRSFLIDRIALRDDPPLNRSRRHVEQEESRLPRHLLARRVAHVREARRRKRLGRVDFADAEVLGGE